MALVCAFTTVHLNSLRCTYHFCAFLLDSMRIWDLVTEYHYGSYEPLMEEMGEKEDQGEML